jgi:hypothetical protein
MSDLARQLREQHALDAAPAGDPLRIAVEEIERLSDVVKAASRALRDAQLQISGLLDERDALLADAARYRWLRDVDHGDAVRTLESTPADGLDREIDEAMTHPRPERG